MKIQSYIYNSILYMHAELWVFLTVGMNKYEDSSELTQDHSRCVKMFNTYSDFYS